MTIVNAPAASPQRSLAPIVLSTIAIVNSSVALTHSLTRPTQREIGEEAYREFIAMLAYDVDLFIQEFGLRYDPTGVRALKEALGPLLLPLDSLDEQSAPDG